MSLALPPLLKTHIVIPKILASLAPSPLLKTHYKIPKIFVEIIAAIEKEDLQEIVSREICEKINSGEYEDEYEGKNLLSNETTFISKLIQLCDVQKGLDFVCVKKDGKQYTLLQYAIIMDKPNWVQQLLNCGARLTPSSDKNDIYETASPNIKMIPQIQDLLKTIGYVELPKNNSSDGGNGGGSGGGGSGGGGSGGGGSGKGAWI